MFEIKDLFFRYTDQVVFEGLSAGIKKNRINVVIGPNGCGKSTLLKILGRILAPQKGQILLDGRDIRVIRPQEYHRRVGLMFSDIHFIFNYRVLEFILMARYPYVSPLAGYRPEDLEAAEKAVRVAGVEGLREKGLQQISSGEMQLVLIAHLLAQETDVLLLDEPFSHLDLKHQHQVMDILKKVTDKTIVLVTHQVDRLAGFADYVILLKERRLYRQGSFRKVLTKPHIRSLYGI